MATVDIYVEVDVEALRDIAKAADEVLELSNREVMNVRLDRALTALEDALVRAGIRIRDRI